MSGQYEFLAETGGSATGNYYGFNLKFTMTDNNSEGSTLSATKVADLIAGDAEGFTAAIIAWVESQLPSAPNNAGDWEVVFLTGPDIITPNPLFP